MKNKGLKISLALLVAIVCGIFIGICAAELKFKQNPWKGNMGAPAEPAGGKVIVDQEDFNFGKLDVNENGKHEFTVTNRGDRKLTLNTGTTSCSCTVSEIQDGELDPGESTHVTVTWRSKSHIGRFHQSVTIVTSDPNRREVTFNINGEFTRSVYAEPDELTFGQIAGNQPISRESCILCTSPKQEIRIQRHALSNPSQDQFFQVDYVPLSADELRKHQGATGGVLVRVTVKPGLPLGRFEQRITLATNVDKVPEIELPLFGSVGDITLVGPGWSSETGLLDLGEVDRRSATQRKLVILVRGADAKQTRFKVASAEPDYLQARLGETTVASGGELSETELRIEIPERKTLEKKASLGPSGAGKGNLGEILLETTGPQVRSLRVRVRFTATGGSQPK